MAKKEVYWCGHIGKCDICQEPLKNVMYDARTQRGPWGNLCEKCFQAHGVGLGTGLGQKYALQTDGRFKKVGG